MGDQVIISTLHELKLIAYGLIKLNSWGVKQY